MKMKNTIVLSIVTLLLLAFTGPISTGPIGVTAYSDSTSATIAASTTYLGIVINNSEPIVTSTSATPSSGSAESSSSSYAPQPGDDKLIRDKVFLDLESSRLEIIGTAP